MSLSWTVTNLLRRAGYATAIAGKWRLGGGERAPRGTEVPISKDAGTRVPLIASWTGTTASSELRPELVDVGDLFPTLLEVAGIRDGRGFREDRIGFHRTLTTGAAHFRSCIFRDYHRGKKTPISLPARWVQDIRYKRYSDGRSFDYDADPLEKCPLRMELSTNDLPDRP